MAHLKTYFGPVSQYPTDCPAGAVNTTTTHDLGNGWFADWTKSTCPSLETMTIHNADKWLRIDLAAESLDRLRALFAAAGKES